MATTTIKSTKELLAELAGETCRCGGRKKRRMTFCGHCFFRLPDEKRRALYKRIGDGYEQAYADAVEYLYAKPTGDGPRAA